MEQGVIKHRRTTLERAEKFICSVNFTDVNLRGRLYPKSTPVTSVSHWAALADIYTPYEQAVKQNYSSVNIGQQFGPTWATHWFRVDVEIPVEWVGQEVKLRWNSGSEALVWVQGKPRQGLCSEYDRLDFTLADCVTEDCRSFSLYIEMACNGMFGAGEGLIGPPDMKKKFSLSMCEIAVFDRKVYDLIRDVEILHDMAKYLGEESERGYQALYAVNAIVNQCDVNDPATYKRCREIAGKFFSQKNGDSQHVTYAMGHSHIDTAWLWPYSETKRKCARSWSCTLRLLEQYPDFSFTCSQAQQYEWMKEQYPSLYEDMKKFIKQGRFIPVGGTWVEMDGLIPSGEAFIRQFLYGQRYFQKEFGFTCKEFWLPDTFGYSGQLPQIMRHCGISRFLTQKMSWNLVNKFPHHTFWWEGISGHKVLSHFPPGDSYEMKGTVEEILRTAKNHRDKGRTNKTAFLFGYGDGGNGPSEDMLERLNRMKDVDGLPKVKMSTPDALFSDIEREDMHNLCRWTGELYLELHNGTYTTHAKVKKMNRLCEFLLHDVEFMSSFAVLCDTDFRYPKSELDRLWKLLLLNQFHDVLPGSSIGMVYDDAHRYYKDIHASCCNLLSQAIEGMQVEDLDLSWFMWNTQSFNRSEVISIATPSSRKDGVAQQPRLEEELPKAEQHDAAGNALYHVNVPSYGCKELSCCSQDDIEPVSVTKVADGSFIMKNSCIEAHVDRLGRVVKIFVAGCNRNAIDEKYPGNQFVLHEDIPLFWDAWDIMDYHMETRQPIVTVNSEAVVTDKGPLRATLQVKLRISAVSHIKQEIILDARCPYLHFKTKVVWHENHKLLKVEFPTSVLTREASYDIQCGHIRRPNHRNTSWDTARFEVCGHKWSDLSEHDFGVALLNDCKYGHSALDNVLRMSLLRSAKAPDQNADMGTHKFSYALMPHTGSLQSAEVNKYACCFNNPLLVRAAALHCTTRCFKVSTTQVVLETIKMAEDDETNEFYSNFVLRFYEAHGGSCAATLTSSFPLANVQLVNGLEERITDETGVDPKITDHDCGALMTFNMKPFQIVSFIVKAGRLS